jgi:DNA (cytosine-5)-methyltransferase 1
MSDTDFMVFYGNRVSDIRMQGDVINTLQARMGTGGNNMPMVALIRMREGKPGGGKGPLISEDKSLTIATSNDQTLLNKGTVRRLTPVECERLQGFPDNWTEGQSDSARYKQMGNAVAVPVVEWIIQNICDTV